GAGCSSIKPGRRSWLGSIVRRQRLSTKSMRRGTAKAASRNGSRRLLVAIQSPVWVRSHRRLNVGKLSEDDLAWRRRATSVEASSTARPGILRVIKITEGSGAHSAGPRFFFPVELVRLEGQEDLSAFKNLVVQQISEFGSNQYSKKLSELSKSESL